MKKLIIVIGSILAANVFAAEHVQVGVTAQDEAVALVLDEGLTQEKYLSMSYGTDYKKMLDDAFEARGSNWVEGVAFVKQLSKGDVRNVPCIEPTPKKTVRSYAKFMQRNRSATFTPSEVVNVSGRMFNEPDAFDTLVSRLVKKVGKPVVFSGEGKSRYKDRFDAEGISYSFWPLGIAVHSNTSYAEEVAHFFNFVDPRERPNRFKGTWSSTDYEKVSQWNEFLSAFRGVKVYAYSRGYNLNTASADGKSQFDRFFESIKTEYEQWINGAPWPISTNAMMLLMAYEEAKMNEGLGTDNSAYRRFRTICRDNQISKMVL
jgi:hypothetical protein